MKRWLIVGGAVLAVLAILVMGLVFVVAVTPLHTQIGSALTRVFEARPVLAAGQAQTANPQLQLKDEKGVLVGGVFTGSPADKAGIVRGDILLQVDGQAVNTNADLRGVLAKHKEGDSISVLLQHGDQQKTVTVTLAAPVTRSGAAPQKAAPQATPQGTPQSGQQSQSAQPVPFLGVVPIGTGFGRAANKTAVMGTITQVASGSPAEKAGLKAGEVITAVDGTALDAQNSLSALIAKHKPGDAVKLSVTGTDGASRDVTVTLGDNPQKAGSAYLGVSVAGGRGRFFRGMPSFGMPGQPGNPNNTQPFHRGLNPNLAGHQGAYIETVTSGSPAEKAGLKAGQLIVSVDGKAINSETALSDAISTHKPGDAVTLSVFNPQTNQTSDVKATLGDNPQKAGSPWLGISYGYINPQPGQNQSGTSF